MQGERTDDEVRRNRINPRVIKRKDVEMEEETIPNIDTFRP